MSKKVIISGTVVNVLLGRQVDAEYIEQYVDDYEGNLLIEALPQIFTANKVGEMLYSYPVCREKDKDLEPEIRLHLVEQVRNFMLPFTYHIMMEASISRLIRRGYVGRNPLSPYFARQFAIGVKEILNTNLDDDGNNLVGNRSTASSYTVLGISGIGKTTAIEKMLLMYPQVIVHSDYQRNGLSLGYLKQIVWLKLECPFNSTLKGLCISFFVAVDQILQTDYYQKHVKSRTVVEELLTSMAHVCALHCIGVLVIDEINRLKNIEGEEILEFFVELNNKLGIPQVYVGTYKISKMLGKMLGVGRRVSKEGAEFLDPMVPGDDWDLFLGQLWDLQWTKEKVALTKELNDTIYQLTAGITDFVVNLFIKAQQYAIITGKERLTKSIFTNVAHENLKIVQPTIQAIMSGDRTAIEKYGDLKPDWVTVNEYIEKYGNKIRLHGKMAVDHKRAQNKSNYSSYYNELLETAINLGATNEDAKKIVTGVMDSSNNMQDLVHMRQMVAKLVIGNSEEINTPKELKGESKNKNKGKIVNFPNKNDIRLIVEEAKRKKVPIDQALQEAEIIKPFDEFLRY
jgi:hypothetical protein